MKITKRWLQTKSACREGIDWVEENCKDGEAVDVIRALMAHRFDWANWLIVRVMDRPQKLAYAIFAAEQVLGIYEKKYPNNKAPREAIEAAKAVLKNDTAENMDIAKKKRAAAAAAAYAAAAAADAYAAYAAYAAAAAAAAAYADAAAAYAAAAAAYADAAAADAYADAYAAAYAAAAAAAAYADAAADAAAYAAKKQIKIKILEYGLSLLKDK